MSKIVVSQGVFDRSLTLFGMEVYEHLVTEGRCEHAWKMRTHVSEDMCGQAIFASAWSECDNCGETKDQLDLFDESGHVPVDAVEGDRGVVGQ